MAVGLVTGTTAGLYPTDTDHRADRLAVIVDRRSHNPILRGAAFGRDSLPIARLGRRKIESAFR